ncbi:MAG: serine protease [Alcanivorax sp.]|nr:serine protease [Alcanivorax sp.]
MYRFIVALLLALGLMQTVSALEAQPRIIGGQDVAQIRPWMAEVEISRSGDPADAATICGGVLVAPGWVLTAAHCVTTASGTVVSPNYLFAALGELDRLSTPQQRLAVASIHVHPDYRSDVYQNDLALLELSAPASEPPLDLATESVMDRLSAGPSDEALQVLGWGQTDTQTLSDTLQQADLDYVSPSYCASEWGNLTDKQICAGEMNPQGGVKQDTCRGDSGGPLLYQQNGQVWLVGVTSYGSEQCASDGVPSVYTRVASYLDWLEQASNGALVNLADDVLPRAYYLSPGQPLNITTRITNSSLVSTAKDVGIRIIHVSGLQVSAAGMTCEDHDTYTDCLSGQDLAVNQSTGTLSLTMSSDVKWYDDIRVAPISTSGHDYFQQGDQRFRLVFSDEPDVSLMLTSRKHNDKVIVRATVTNNSTLHGAARVRMGVTLPDGWQGPLPKDCYGSSSIQCGLGDLAPGGAASREWSLSGSGSGEMQVQVWTDNGDYPAGDTRKSTSLAQARSAAQEQPKTTDSGGGGGGGGSPTPATLIGLLAVLFFRRIHQ